MTNNVIIGKDGTLLENEVLYRVFDRDKLTFINELRYELIRYFPNLREKINKNSKYFGYGISSQNDACYIYFQNKSMIMDINLPKSMKEDIAFHGFSIKERINFQAKSGWITGIKINYDCQDIKVVKTLVIKSLSNLRGIL